MERRKEGIAWRGRFWTLEPGGVSGEDCQNAPFARAALTFWDGSHFRIDAVYKRAFLWLGVLHGSHDCGRAVGEGVDDDGGIDGSVARFDALGRGRGRRLLGKR